MKKQLPRTLTEILDKAIGNERHLFDFNTSINSLLIITEKNDSNSPYFFSIGYRRNRFAGYSGNDGYYSNIEDEEADKDDELNNRKYECQYFPSRLEDTSTLLATASLGELPNHLKIWTDLLKEYNKHSPTFDDPILQKYYDDIETTFTTTDADADIAPFSRELQGMLSSAYDKIKELVEEERGDDNSEEADYLLKQITAAQRSIGKSTKRQALHTMQKIVALCQKYSYHVGKVILDGAIFEIAKYLLIGG